MDSVGFALTIALRTFALATTGMPDAAPPPETPAERVATDRDLRGVAAASEAPGLLATWDSTEVRLSQDDGRTFEPVVEAPDGLSVTRAALSAEGRLYVVLDGPRGPAVSVGTAARLITVERTGARGESSLPPGEVDMLVAGRGGDLAVVLHRPAEAVPELVSASVDAGATWIAQDVYVGNAGFELAWSADGVLDVMTGSEASCGGGYQERWSGRVRDDAWTTVAWPLDTPLSWGVGAERFAYAVDHDGCDDAHPTGPAVCAVRDGRSTVALPLPAESFDAFTVVTNGPHTLAQLGSTLLSLHGSRARVLSNAVPGDVEVHTTDARGRALGLWQGRPVRFAGAGWQPLP